MRRMVLHRCAAVLAAVALSAPGCTSNGDDQRPPAPALPGFYEIANGCYAIDAAPRGSANARWLAATADGSGYQFSATAMDAAARFTLRASDLGTYLLYDETRHYVVGDGDALVRQAALQSDILLVDDAFVSPAEWHLER